MRIPALLLSTALVSLVVPDEALAAKCPKDTKTYRQKHSNGAIKALGCVNDSGVKQGPWEQWDIDGQLIAQGEYAANEKAGTWVEWWPDGAQKSSCQFKAGKKAGPCTEFHPNGQIDTETVWNDGRRDGAYKAYYDNGKLKEEGEYAADYSAPGADKRTGVWVLYYATGEKRLQTLFDVGEANGPWYEWWDNGALKVHAKKAADKFVGEIVTFHPTGRKRMSAKYDDGQLNGPATFFAPSGRKIEEAAYRDGNRHGVSKVFTLDGKLSATQCFQYGERQWIVDGSEKTVPACPDRFGVVFRPAIREGKEFSDGYAAVNIGGKWGFINEKGTVSINPQFKEVRAFVDGKVGVTVDGSSWYTIDKTGTRLQGVTPPGADARGEAKGISLVNNDGRIDYYRSGRSLWASSEPEVEQGAARFAVQKDGKWGYIDEKGNLAIPATYEYAGAFSEGLAAVGIGGRLGYIDGNGKIVVEARYGKAGPYRCGMALVETERGATFLDRWGLPITSVAIQEAHPCQDGLARVKSGGLYGFLHSSGRMIVAPRFEEVLDFDNGFAPAPRDVTYVDRTGRSVFDRMMPLTAFHDDTAIANDRSDGKDEFVVLWANGNKYAIDAKIAKRDAAFSTFNDGLAAVSGGGQTGYVDRRGKMKIPLSYKAGHGFSEGMAATQTDAGWGFIDAEGKVVVAHAYSDAGDFHSGIARVQKDGKWGFVNKKGDLVVAATYDEAWDAQRGLAKVRVGDTFGYVDANGKVVWNPTK